MTTCAHPKLTHVENDPPNPFLYVCDICGGMFTIAIRPYEIGVTRGEAKWQTP